MKYRLPGIYLGNIPLDLFMEYMSDEDLSDQLIDNDYYKTNDRTDNVQVFRVDFTYNTVDYNFYTYNIQNTTQIRETIRTYFTDIISDTPDYDTNVDAIVFTVQPTISINNPELFDTLGHPSIYGLHMVNDLGENKYMISVKGSGNEDLSSYSAIVQYINGSTEPVEVTVNDLRYATPHLISTLYIDPSSQLGESSVVLLEYIYSGPDIVDVKENELFFGERSLLNYIGNDSDGEGVFFFRDRFGGLSTSQYKNVMSWDIENNRSLSDKSIQTKMLAIENWLNFSSVAGIVRAQKEDNDKVDITFSKYDKYDITKTFEKVDSIPVEITDVRFEDIEPKKINLINNAVGSIYTFNDSSMITYTDLINSANLPKFKAIHKTDGETEQYYIFDIINGNVPEYRGTELDSDDKTLCLLDVYSKASIIVKSLREDDKEHSLKYNVSLDGENIIRTVNFGGRDHYVKLADNENELTAYIIMHSETSNTFATAEELINDFSFADLGLDVRDTDVYPLLYEKVGGETVVTKWGLDIQISEEEKLTVELKDIAEGSPENFGKFMDETTLDGKLYFKFPVTLDISNRPTELVEDVLVTIRTKRLVSANDYNFETFGYWATSTEANYLIEAPIFTEYEDTETKPYNNISDYLTLNNFTWVVLDENYSKEYYIVNEFDQSNIYKVTEVVQHEVNPVNVYPYDNTFIKVDSKINSSLNQNSINSFVRRLGTAISIDDRGSLVSSDILGTDLIEGLKNEFRRGFNNLFYGIGNYNYNYTLDNLNDKEKLDFLRNSLVSYDSLNKLLNAFLRYNFVSTNEYLYTIDSNFRMGFFVKKNNGDEVDNKLFTNWLSSVPDSVISASNLNTFQKIKGYEKLSSDEDISKKARIDWIKNHLLYSENNNTTTGYQVSKESPVPLKDINNKEVLNQAFDMLMDQRYNATKVIGSFANTNISKLVLLDTKEKNLFSGTQEAVRFINSNQSVDVMIKSYLDGFGRKVGE